MEPDVLCYPVAFNGVLTRVFEAGRGPKSLLFIHGLGARADRWRHNIAAVADAGRRAIALDLPGHGFAEKDAAFPHGMPAYAEFVRAAIRGLGLDRPVLVGTSLGGHIAAAVACADPDLVSGLVLIGSTGLFPIGDEARERLATRAVDRSIAGIESKAKTVFFDPSLASEHFITEEHRVNNSPGADGVFTVLAEYFRKRLDADAVGERLAQMKPRPPIQLVWGAQDRSVPLAIGQAAARLLAPSPLEVIDEAAHAPYLEKPEEFNRLLLNFIRGLD